MPKTVEHFSLVRLKSIKKLHDVHRSSGSRSEYIGHRGEAYIIESEHRHPGKRYVYFTNHDTIRFSTGYGSYSVSNDILRMRTENTIYEFEIL